jgi:predicted HAD superfamily phosphohydrolase YqeG
VELIVVDSIGDALEACKRRGFTYFAVDLENTLVGYNSRSALESGRLQIPALPRGALIVSNASWTDRWDSIGQQRLIGRARKPFTRRKTIEAASAGLLQCVVGDQVLTDGLLAWRLRLPFVHVVRPIRNEPSWPQLMRAIAFPLTKTLFRQS